MWWMARCAAAIPPSPSSAPIRAKATASRFKIATQRHNDDPAFRPLFGIDRITLTLAGREDGNTAEFEGTALQVPGVAFRAVLSRISD
ncbi:hypothetical protein [Bradyrhizobium arachidis]|uniref:hypothetical protein n=1 Tax=Bradyrhizobium arachidis TaxID=858423 RepID=UPI0008E5B911|nr:hypothetical protein [Bradyrhizobium arachidis]SFU67418.1 hypothetical protein SAMN05192541_103532 [Bradyrhizobium arachidis]